jgi:hypothetical protein
MHSMLSVHILLALKYTCLDLFKFYNDLVGGRAGVRPAGALAADVVVVGIRARADAGA